MIPPVLISLASSLILKASKDIYQKTVTTVSSALAEQVLTQVNNNQNLSKDLPQPPPPIMKENNNSNV